MNYFLVEPDVAGGLGPNTVLDGAVHPPRVERLHFEFYGWFGDVLVTSFPCYLITEEACNELKKIGATGACFDDVEVTESDEFQELFPETQLPKFLWLKPASRSGDDFLLRPDTELIVSERAISVLQRLGIPNAIVSSWTA